jgi:hypothetical protein
MPSPTRRARVIARYLHARANWEEANRALAAAPRAPRAYRAALDAERAAWRVLFAADQALGITVTDAEKLAIGRAYVEAHA